MKQTTAAAKLCIYKSRVLHSAKPRLGEIYLLQVLKTPQAPFQSLFFLQTHCERTIKNYIEKTDA